MTTFRKSHTMMKTVTEYGRPGEWASGRDFSHTPTHPSSHTHILALLTLLALLLVGCGGGDGDSDAYGTFEATEVRLSAEVGGRLLHFDVDEGATLASGEAVGLIDTTDLALQRREVRANRTAVRAKARSVLAEIDVLEEERQTLRTEQQRLQRLLADSAATQQQLDQVDGQLRVIDRRMQAIRTQNAAVLSELEALDARLAQLDERLRKSRLVNPMAGTVLTTYASAHELVSPGAPLYEIADLDTMILRAYVSGAQLPHVRLGQAATVLVDEDAETDRALPGTVRWIASEAEFTPTMIQTKKERVTLVYAVEIHVPNPDGRIKIGMPGEVRFREVTP